MARGYSSEGVILKKINLGEADRLFTILTKYKGKINAIAKGVRKVASRRSPNLELLNHVKAQFAAGKTFDVITEVKALDTYKKIKEDLLKVSLGFHIAEITNEFLAEGQNNREVFELLIATLQRLNSEKNGEKIKKIVRAFEIKLLAIIGYKPQLERCVKCGSGLITTGNFFSPGAGGLLDRGCSMGTSSSRPISVNAVKILRFLQNGSWEKIDRLLVSPTDNLELEKLLKFYIEYLLEKELKSVRFVEQVVKKVL